MTSSVRCGGHQQPEICMNGVWIPNGQPCNAQIPVCYNGLCVVCSPGATSCVGQQPYTCNASGSGLQATGTPCDPGTTCVGGTCAGVCGPGQKQCSTASQPQTCGTSGFWQNATACNASQTCVSGSCTGECGPGQAQCVGQQPQTCSATGTWQNGTTCDASHTCVAGACVGVCGPGQTQCSSSTLPQTCSSTGTWQNTTACSGSTPYCLNGSCSAEPATSCVGASPPWDGGAADAGAGSGLSNCGLSYNDNCCASPEVTGGTFYRTYQAYYLPVTGQADPATVSNFRLDKYDVSVGRFRKFVAAWNNGSGYTPPAGSGKHTHLNGGQGLVDSAVEAGTTYESGWSTAYNANVAPTNTNLACNSGFDETWTSSPGSGENLPINCVNWYEAYAFCIWDGGFLPSEAEYGYAAAGGSDQRLYPWGQTDPNNNDGWAVYNCDMHAGACNGADISRVGLASNGAGKWGQLDLVGNLYQLLLDWSGTFASPCTDCASLSAGGSYRVERGGTFSSTFYYIESSTRSAGSPTARYDFAGFRCARIP